MTWYLKSRCPDLTFGGLLCIAGYEHACSGVIVCHACIHPQCRRGEGRWGSPQGQLSLQRERWSSHFTPDKIELIISHSGWCALCSLPCSLPSNSLIALALCLSPFLHFHWEKYVSVLPSLPNKSAGSFCSP